ncbi:hypothetical protein BS78_K154900 [Paspalum vaginatum]|uniref:Uncharacterized protein n=1 Tax=Paspalum vaginatum TaxID=158149 RepID=A0A9W8CGF1_9POAL|nr:hypothetical protein BS78_K154900 [Paspalum vaginatum]
MPCCQTVLSAAAAAASSTPSWLHRLHAKGGLSFPSHLNIDDLLYGRRQLPPQPFLPPAPSSSNLHTDLAVVAREAPHKAAAKPNHLPQQQQLRPARNPSRPNPSSTNSPQPPPQLKLAAVISDVFAVPSSAPPGTPPPKAFRKQSRPRPRNDDDQPMPAFLGPRPNKDKKDKIAKAKKRRRAERAADADGERCSRTDVTVIDTSIDGWKAAKLLIRRGDVWKVRDKKPLAVSELEDAISKGKRRAGLVSKLQRDKEKEKMKEKEAVTSGNIHAGTDLMQNQMVPFKPRKDLSCSEPEPEGRSA